MAAAPARGPLALLCAVALVAGARGQGGCGPEEPGPPQDEVAFSIQVGSLEVEAEAGTAMARVGVSIDASLTPGAGAGAARRTFPVLLCATRDGAPVGQATMQAEAGRLTRGQLALAVPLQRDRVPPGMYAVRAYASLDGSAGDATPADNVATASVQVGRRFRSLDRVSGVDYRTSVIRSQLERDGLIVLEAPILNFGDRPGPGLEPAALGWAARAEGGGALPVEPFPTSLGPLLPGGVARPAAWLDLRGLTPRPTRVLAKFSVDAGDMVPDNDSTDEVVLDVGAPGSEEPRLSLEASGRGIEFRPARRGDVLGVAAVEELGVANLGGEAAVLEWKVTLVRPRDAPVAEGRIVADGSQRWVLPTLATTTYMVGDCTRAFAFRLEAAATWLSAAGPARTAPVSVEFEQVLTEETCRFSLASE